MLARNSLHYFNNTMKYEIFTFVVLELIFVVAFAPALPVGLPLFFCSIGYTEGDDLHMMSNTLHLLYGTTAHIATDPGVHAAMTTRCPQAF